MKPKRIFINGQEMTLDEISNLTGLSKGTLIQRIYQGKQGEELLLPKFPTYLTIKHRTLLITEWMEELGLTPYEGFWFHQRYRKGLTEADYMWMERKRWEKEMVQKEQTG